jgi:2-oxoglutarate dehydrogenase E2 component (dihydrolipoamide succinyltransferase)
MVVGTWLKHVGESVTQNEPLLEITTDKVTVEIAAPATGILREILKSADQPVQAGEVLGRIEVGGTAAAEPSDYPSRKVPHTGMRRSIAQHMVQSVAVAPHVTTVFEADLSAIVAHREAHRAGFEADGVKLTYTAYFVRACVAALQAVPEANSRWHDDALELFDDCNIGVATALPKGGLILPVIHRAQTLDLRATAERLQALTQRARDGALSPNEVRHGTFSISNHGVSGSLVAAPIVIPQPQSAILGVGKLERRPVARERSGKEVVEVRPMCYVTLTIDHRVLDGYQANAFLARWVEEIEGWG